MGFGQATFEMRELLREAGLGLSNENHQYEDHMGIELLLLSELFRRAAAADGDAAAAADGDAAGAVAVDDAAALVRKAASFAVEHPAAWIDAFRAKVTEAAPDGYFASLLGMVEALLQVATR